MIFLSLFLGSLDSSVSVVGENRLVDDRSPVKSPLNHPGGSKDNLRLIFGYSERQGGVIVVLLTPGLAFILISH